METPVQGVQRVQATIITVGEEMPAGGKPSEQYVTDLAQTTVDTPHVTRHCIQLPPKHSNVSKDTKVTDDPNKKDSEFCDVGKNSDAGTPTNPSRKTSSVTTSS